MTMQHSFNNRGHWIS